MVRTRNGLILIGQWIYCIVYCEALAWILMILVNHRLAGQFRYAHDAVGIVHTILLDAVDGGVHLATRTVEVGSMDVDAQGLSADLLGVDACRISQPVMGMNDVVVEGTSHHTGDDGIVVDFLVQVARIAASKLHGAQIVDVHVVEVSIQVVAQAEIEVGVHDVPYPFANIVSRHVAPGNGHSVHGYDVAGRTVFVAEGMRQTERNVHVALGMQALRDTIVSGGQSTEYVRRILPSKH